MRGEWKRWLKILFGIDPLVGMYFVEQRVIGIVLARVEAKRYLLHYFCGATGTEKETEHCVVSDLPNPLYCWHFFYNRREAERWRNRYAGRPKPHPQPIRTELQN